MPVDLVDNPLETSCHSGHYLDLRMFCSTSRGYLPDCACPYRQLATYDETYVLRTSTQIDRNVQKLRLSQQGPCSLERYTRSI